MPALDGLRALAVTAVLLYHADLEWIPGGFLGVEVFFVISGYLITLLLVTEHEQYGRISLKNFWFRRARRLLPAVYVLLLVVSLTVVLFVREQAAQTRGDVIAGLDVHHQLVPHRHRAVVLRELRPTAAAAAPLVARRRGAVLPGVAADPGGPAAWSCKRRPERMAIPMLAMVLVSTVLMAVLYNAADPSRVYFGTDTRAGGLILGATFALFWRPGFLRRGAVAAKGRLLDLVGLAGLGALALIMATVADQDAVLYRGGFLVVGSARSPCIAMATHPGSVIAKVLSLPPDRLGRHPLVCHLPVALAGLRAHPTGRGRAVVAGTHAGVPAGPDRRAGRTVVPARREPDPPRRRPPVVDRAVPPEGRRSHAAGCARPAGSPAACASPSW